MVEKHVQYGANVQGDDIQYKAQGLRIQNQGLNEIECDVQWMLGAMTINANQWGYNNRIEKGGVALVMIKHAN